MPNAVSPDGLIHALLLDGRGGKSDVPWESTDEWEPGRGCLWLHLNFEDPAIQQWLIKSSGLSDRTAIRYSGDKQTDKGAVCNPPRPVNRS